MMTCWLAGSMVAVVTRLSRQAVRPLVVNVLRLRIWVVPCGLAPLILCRNLLTVVFTLQSCFRVLVR